MGYHRAGFDVVGVDIAPQPRYPFEFHQTDALQLLDRFYLRDERPTFGFGRPFDAIHASPPCQAYSVARNIHGRGDHPMLIPALRERLVASGLPYVIENVPGSPLLNPTTLCGLTFGLNVKRHRWFESSVFMLSPPCNGHLGDWLLVFGHTVLERGHQSGRAKGGGPVIRRRHVGTDRGREAMGIDWMNRDELSEAIPPAYTQWIGERLMTALR